MKTFEKIQAETRIFCKFLNFSPIHCTILYVLYTVNRFLGNTMKSCIFWKYIQQVIVLEDFCTGLSERTTVFMLLVKKYFKIYVQVEILYICCMWNSNYMPKRYLKCMGNIRPQKAVFSVIHIYIFALWLTM